MLSNSLDRNQILEFQDEDVLESQNAHALITFSGNQTPEHRIAKVDCLLSTPIVPATPLIVETAKILRFLRPLKAKLISFQKASLEAPEAFRSLMNPLQKRNTISKPNVHGFSSTSSSNTRTLFVYSNRKRFKAHLSDTHTKFKLSNESIISTTPVSPSQISTNIATPLRGSVLSIQDGFREIINKTSNATYPRKVYALSQLVAFGLGQVIAENTMHDDDVTELQTMYSEIPSHLRGCVSFICCIINLFLGI
jgi:hypothetical protein